MFIVELGKINSSTEIRNFIYFFRRYDHGPQVPDPREGQWLAYTEGHERW